MELFRRELRWDRAERIAEGFVGGEEWYPGESGAEKVRRIGCGVDVAGQCVGGTMR